MQEESQREPTLAEIEEEVLAEGREWTRQRLEQKLRERAERISQSFSPRVRAAGASPRADAEPAKRCRQD
jgi:hypothetical protein